MIDEGKKVHVDELAGLASDGLTKEDVHRGEDFNVLVIRLEEGREIPVHHEEYNVFFYVVSGRGRFTLHGRTQDLSAGEMVYSPAGERGIVALERLCLLGVQEPH